MSDIIQSKGWDWKLVPDDSADVWKNPSIESYYLLNRWQDKKDFLDLGCGLGRHTILFGKHGFHVSACDIEPTAIQRTQKWADQEKIPVRFAVCDMLNLPYEPNSFDCILCRNVISHTDTNGMKRIVAQLEQILRPSGECYLTLGSKSSWGFQQNWPYVDANTKLRMEEGPEYQVPHFYADYDLIQDLFQNFQILLINHIGTFHEQNNTISQSYHYHLLIRRP